MVIVMNHLYCAKVISFCTLHSTPSCRGSEPPLRAQQVRGSRKSANCTSISVVLQLNTLIKREEYGRFGTVSQL